MFNSLRFNLSKACGKIALYGMRFSSGMGKSFPGNLFLRVGSYDSFKKLAKTPRLGNILISGTNGKTTTTKIIIKLFEKEYNITYNFESNTINAIATGLLKDDVDLGIFEYGIRDIAHGIPDVICKNVDPIGVTYTNVSREHTQVVGVKNSFEDYLRAKSLLSQCMSRGVIVTNADNVNTSYIGQNKEKDVEVNYYGLDYDGETNFSKCLDINCPKCSKTINLEKLFMCGNGVYECECGFKRPELNIKITDVDFNPDMWSFTIKGNPYNYFIKKPFEFEFKCRFPPLGLYNLYNGLAAISTYVTFTSNIDKIEEVITSVFNNLDSSILPPGRFEIFKEGNKIIGMGQGDNGYALKANTEFIEFYISQDSRKKSEMNIEYVYTTPDDNEEEIFEDHLVSLKSINPTKIHVIPGRNSIEMAERCYETIKKDFNAEFHPIGPDKMPERIQKVCDLVLDSNADYVVAAGCGEEIAFWENIKKNFK